MLRSLWIRQRWITASEPNTVVMAENKAFASSMTNCSRSGRRAAGRRHASDGFACTSRRSRGFQPGQGTRPAPAAQHPRFPQSGLTIRGKRLVRALGRRRQAVKQSSNGSPRSNLPSTAVSCSLPGMRVSMVSRRCAALPTSRDARSPRTTTPDPAPDRGPREACPSWRTGRSCIPVRKRSLQ
jgi:hypothetical protein